MKTDVQIKCPNCDFEFSPNEAIWNQLKSEVESELNSELAVQRSMLEKDKEHVQKLTFELSAQKVELEQMLASKTSLMRSELIEKLNSEKSEELKLLEESLVKKTRLVSDSRREIMRLKEEAENREVEISLRHADKMREALESLRNQTEEAHQLEAAQNRKIVSDLRAQLELAAKKVTQYSGQLIGESAELELEQMLKDTFGQGSGNGHDSIFEVPKGIRGGDCIQEVKTSSGTLIGKILYESKNVQNFSHGWIQKLKEDNAQIGASALVIVTRVLPKELEGQKFGILDEVFITTHSMARETATLIRYSLLKISQVMLTYQGKETKEQLLFQFLTSPKFLSIYQRVLSQMESIRSSHEEEKKKLIKLWSERERAISVAISSTVELLGNLRGITDEIPSLDSLELNLPKAG